MTRLLRAGTGVGTGVGVGAVLWLVRPLYLLAEYVVAAGVRGSYSFADDTVSDLGVLGCVQGAGGAQLCSPRHGLMNGSFVVFGVAMALGAVLVAPALGRGWRDGAVRAVVVALVVAGASSVATGLAPLDQDAGLHYAVALPVFVAQPVGLLLLARVLGRRTPEGARGARGARAVAALLVVAGVASAVGAVWFGLGGEDLPARGAVERLALWPTFVALAVVGASLLAPTGRRRADPAG